MALDDPMVMMLSRTEKKKNTPTAEVLLRTLAVKLADELSGKQKAGILQKR